MGILDLFKSSDGKYTGELNKLLIIASQFEKENRFKEAADIYGKAISYKWSDGSLWNSYAWNKYLSHQVDFSILEAASIACFLSQFQEHNALDTKAAVLAQLGFFNEAMSTWKVAFTVMRSKGIKDDKIYERLYSALNTVFISYDFNRVGQDLTDGIIENNNNLESRFEVKTAKEFSMSCINDKVQLILKQSFFLVAIITKRDVRENGMFGVSNWIVAEVAIASSQNKEFVLMVEEGVDINELSCVKQNLEYISFTHTSFAQASAKVIRVLKNRRDQLLSEVIT